MSIIPSAKAPVAEGILSRRLVEAKTPRDFRETAELAEFAQKCARRADWSYRLQRKYGCIRIDALQRLGEALAQWPRLKGRPKSVPGRNAFKTLREILGTTTAAEARKIAYLGRKLAAISDGVKNRYLAEAERLAWTVNPDGLIAFANPIERSQHFTDLALAERRYKLTLEKLAEYEIAVDAWIEPTAGDGAFYDLLPPDRRLGIDIDPKRPEFIAGDFLDFEGF